MSKTGKKKKKGFHSWCVNRGSFKSRLDFRLSLVSDLRSSPRRSAGSFPRQRLVMEPTLRQEKLRTIANLKN